VLFAAESQVNLNVRASNRCQEANKGCVEAKQ